MLFKCFSKMTKEISSSYQPSGALLFLDFEHCLIIDFVTKFPAYVDCYQ